MLTDSPVRVELSPGLDLTPEFVEALDRLNHRGENLFITGRAGTGKSTLLQEFKKTTARRVVVLAPTGIAALQAGGQTIHSFFGFPHHYLDPDRVKKSGRFKRVIREMDTLVVDEVSMVRSDVMEAMDRALKLTRQSPLPFGGVQAVFVGDAFQLPPVVERELAGLFTERHSGPYFFDAPVWRELAPRRVELQTVHRQKTDGTFLNLLNAVRDNSLTEDDFIRLNERVGPAGPVPGRVSLVTTRALSRAINERELARLTGRDHCYEALVDGAFDESSFPTEEKLLLKPGAQVMMLRNHPERWWVNGDLGVVEKCGDGFLSVGVRGTSYEVSPVVWEKYAYVMNKKGGLEQKPVGTFLQFPVRLAWAITIHKSQGQTFQEVVVDLGSGAFAHGQTYVALSRCTTLSGLTLRRPLRPSDILCDPRVVEFHERGGNVGINQSLL